MTIREYDGLDYRSLFAAHIDFMHESVTMLYQDKEVRLDVKKDYLKLGHGEYLLEKLENIEDTKANSGEKGTLYVTNLRLIWVSTQLPRVNISLGYNCISNVSIRTTVSKLRGSVESLYIYAKSNSARYEFIFSSLFPGSAKLYTVVNSVFRAYDSSRLYREIKLRGAVIENGVLRLLPEEQLLDTVEGAFNLTGDSGTLGGLFITNVRLVWYSGINDHYNISIPFLAIKSVRVSSSKYGPALALETFNIDSPNSTSNIGFRIDPPEKLQVTAKKIVNFHRLFAKSPIYGLRELKTDSSPQPVPEALKGAQDENEPEEPMKQDALALYYMDSGSAQQRKVIFSKEIGLAIEEPPNGMTLAELWNPL